MSHIISMFILPAFVFLSCLTSMAQDSNLVDCHNRYDAAGPSPFIPVEQQDSQNRDDWDCWLAPLVTKLLQGAILDDYMNENGKATWYITYKSLDGFYGNYRIPKFSDKIIDSWVITDTKLYHLPTENMAQVETAVKYGWETMKKEDYIKTIAFTRYHDSGQEYVYVEFRVAPLFGAGIIYQVINDGDNINLEYVKQTWIS